MIEQLRMGFGYQGNMQGLQAQVYQLDAARYFVLLVEAAILSLLAAQVLWLGGGLTFMGAVEVALVSMLCPALVWFTSKEARRLRSQLENRS